MKSRSLLPTYLSFCDFSIFFGLVVTLFSSSSTLLTASKHRETWSSNHTGWYIYFTHGVVVRHTWQKYRHSFTGDLTKALDYSVHGLLALYAARVYDQRHARQPLGHYECSL